MSKLHEVLAVEQDLEKVATNIVNEAAVTFSKKANLFSGTVKTAEMFDDDAVTPAPEVIKLEETVPSKLDYVGASVARWLDAVAQKEATNQTARADLIVNGETLAENLPATFLLGLETKLKKLRVMYVALPTLPPGVTWDEAPDEGEGVYRTRNPQERFITQKVPVSKVMYDATPEHPAQIEKWTEDVKVGRYLLQSTSGMITPAQKSEILGRIDALLQGAKSARMRANSVDVVPVEVGKTLMDFING